MDEFVEQWLSLHHGKTRRSYENTIFQFRAAVNLPLNQVRSQHVRNWLDSLEVAETTKVKHLAILKAFFNFLLSLESSPLKCSPIPRQFKISSPRDTLVERILTVEEVQEMMENELNQRNLLILKTLYQTGVRVSELCGLRWKDLTQRPEINTAMISVYGKRGKTRHISLKSSLAQELTEFRGNAGANTPIFASASGKPLAPPHIWRVVRRAALRAQLPLADKVSPHWLRHAHATHALDNKAPLRLVQATLGHASLDTTSKYLHIRPNQSSGDYL
ncbi:MAG: tyrosine-type recombinase/integrase [Symploca sp. SIO2E9]|nr:tyrosine-type recombinase/integrase [Symploca sp. SIO2E9]